MFVLQGTLPGYRKLLPTLAANKDFTLTIANRIYLQKGFKPKAKFQKTLSRNFYATAVVTDFSSGTKAAKEMNTWVEKVTHDKIKDLMNPRMLGPATRMVLINAIHFKGDWKTKFNVALTKEKDFLTESGQTVKVPTMHLEMKIEIAVLEQLKSKVLRLPYKGDRIVMDIVLPDDKGGLRVLEKKLKTLNEKDLVNENTLHKEVIVDLPKFKLKKTWRSLKAVLKRLGITAIFHGGLKGIADGPLMVSDVIQKACIEVDETGSEASAATGVLMKFRSTSIDNEKIHFKADHPFLFIIRDTQTGLLLFRGRVSDPSK